MADLEKISVLLSSESSALLREAVTSGDYASDSEVIRDALRALKNERLFRQQMLLELRAEIQKGLDSGRAENYDIQKIISDLQGEK